MNIRVISIDSQLFHDPAAIHLYEGFLLLPEKMVVPFPGMFRMADSIFLILPLFSFNVFPDSVAGHFIASAKNLC